MFKTRVFKNGVEVINIKVGNVEKFINIIDVEISIIDEIKRVEKEYNTVLTENERNKVRQLYYKTWNVPIHWQEGLSQLNQKGFDWEGLIDELDKSIDKLG